MLAIAGLYNALSPSRSMAVPSNAFIFLSTCPGAGSPDLASPAELRVSGFEGG